MCSEYIQKISQALDSGGGSAVGPGGDAVSVCVGEFASPARSRLLGAASTFFFGGGGSTKRLVEISLDLALNCDVLIFRALHTQHTSSSLQD